MAPSVLRRRVATAAGLYLSVTLGILGTVAAARILGLADFGRFATVVAVVGLAQTLLDLTVEESLTKFGFRYVAGQDWGRLHRLFRRALELKLVGGALATIVLLAIAPFADTLFGGDDLAAPMAAAAALPLLAAPENVSASALLLRGRYDLRGWLLSATMGIRLVAIVVGASIGVTAALAALAIGQLFATAISGTAGLQALRRFPRAPTRPLDEDRREIFSFVLQSSIATGVISLRTALAPVLLGLVAGTTQVGYYRVALAPQSGFSAASAPVRLVLLTEQTRDWEHGRTPTVLRGLRRYSLGAAAVAAVSLPIFLLLMPWLVRVVFGPDYLPAVSAARIVLVSAAILLVLGWTKSFPVTIGRPRLRILTHGLETIVLLPLVLVLGDRWGVTGAAVAILISTLVFAAAWLVVLARLRTELRSGRTVGAPTAAGP
ncbi:lipopolysaccharide biosynthesis protein [Gaiella sp.]|jgi:O-antigen/teichoic acid export membrane protein|uniref:lipopolysaccharide biosynthesis protein n=1 Tax=Gaiella sp. TaxID=2663207 RepID=UPI002E32C578|nr:oligosaccharide flippase family protein [Gaiella sp.]HEX5582607.1 oligosaccharide flippase family protein [Gaiella sp.]